MEQVAFDFGETRDRETLSLFPELTHCQAVFRAVDKNPFDDPFLAELVDCQPVQRLKRIGFLGAIDYVRYGNGSESHRRRHNRYDHSIGVAQLALLYADIRGLSLSERRVLAAAGLLHDIGHGPLSHTLEPVFKRFFSISHHQAGMNILYGNSPYGEAIPTILAHYGVDLDEVSKMIEGVHNGPYAFLFSSPTNLDTIEGITRCRSFVAVSHATPSARQIVEEIARAPSLPTTKLDAFWSLKHEVYNVFIHHRSSLIYDGLAQAYMTSEIDRFSPADFMLTEDQLRHRDPLLFYIFAWAKKSSRRVRNRLSASLFEYEVNAPQRSFTIDRSVNLRSPDDLARRYRQTKKRRNLSVASLLETEAE